MTEEFKIEKNVPIPPSRLLGKDTPLVTMEVGDSFVIPAHMRPNIHHAISYQKIRTDKDFTTRKINDKEVRVWRIA